MDIPALEQELLSAASIYPIDQSYLDSYFTSSDSNNEESTIPASSPTSPSLTPTSTSPGSNSFNVPTIKLEPLYNNETGNYSPIIGTPNPNTGKRSSVRKIRRTTRDISHSDDDDERREKVKNSEKKRRDRLSYWFGELHKLLLPPPTEATSEQDKITYARKKRELRKEDILEMTNTHMKDMKHKIKLLSKIISKMSLEHQCQFSGFTQEDVSMAFDAIYSQLKHDKNTNVFKMLLSNLYILAKKSTVPQHEIVVHELAGTHSVDIKSSAQNTPVAISPHTPPPQPILNPLARPVEPDHSYLDVLPVEWGKYVYPDGSVYEGEWRGGKAHGRGTLIYSTGDRYTGEWVATQKQGQDVYKGEWKADRAHGYGVLLYANGNRYAGSWVDDKRHGYGVFESNGTRYEGEWVNGRKEGKGNLYFPTGDVYVALWKNGTAVSGTYSFRADSAWSNPDF